MAVRQRLPGLNYVVLERDPSKDKPFPLVGFNMKVFTIPETSKVLIFFFFVLIVNTRRLVFFLKNYMAYL